jgi:hypothetical protein
MLFYTAEFYRDDCRLKSALIESFLIHFRCLVDFFLTNRQNNKDDVLATDYKLQDIDHDQLLGKLEEEVKKKLKKWRCYANKRGFHITKQRKNEQYEWPTTEMVNSLLPLLKAFKKHASQDNLCPDFQSEMDRIFSEYRIHPITNFG